MQELQRAQNRLVELDSTLESLAVDERNIAAEETQIAKTIEQMMFNEHKVKGHLMSIQAVVTEETESK